MAKDIKVNLDTSKRLYVVKDCNQNDDLVLEANIFENGKSKDLTNTSIVIQALKEDKTYIIQSDNITKEGNKIVAELVRDFTRVSGKTKIEIVLVEEGKQNTTFDFDLSIRESVINGVIESSDTITIIETLTNKIVEAGEIKEVTEDLINNGNAATKGELNLVDGKVNSVDGKVNSVDEKVGLVDDRVDTTNEKVGFLDTDLTNVMYNIIYANKEEFSDNETPATYQEVYALYDNLVTTYPNYFTKSVLGTATDGEEIRQYTLNAPLLTNNSGERADRGKILITSCIHGDERSCSISIYKFLKDVLESESNSALYSFKNKFMVKVVPICNPFGYNANQRFNKNGVDLARNLNANWVKNGVVGDYEYSGESVASEKESQVIQKFIDDNCIFDYSQGIIGADFLLDIHNTAQGGTEYKPELKDQFTWIISSDSNSNRNKFVRSVYQKAIENCSVLWSNRHSILAKNKTFGMYSSHPQLSNIENYGIKKGIKSCQIEISWRIADLDNTRFGKNTFKIGVEMLGNILLQFAESYNYYSEKPIINASLLNPLSATNGAVTKLPLNNIISKSNNILLTSTGGIKVPKGYTKAIITITTAIDKTINSGAVEHRVYVSDDETSNGTNNVAHRNSYQIINSSSLDKINTSYFIVDNLKFSQVINLIAVQVTGATITLGNNTNCKIIFEK